MTSSIAQNPIKFGIIKPSGWGRGVKALRNRKNPAASNISFLCLCLFHSHSVSFLLLRVSLSLSFLAYSTWWAMPPLTVSETLVTERMLLERD